MTLSFNVYFTDQNIKQNGDPIELNFEGLEMQKLNILTDRESSKSRWEKQGHLRSYHV